MLTRGNAFRNSLPSRVFSLKKNHILVEMINQGSGELITWVGVDDDCMDEAIRVLYREFSE